ncbi:MAG: 2-keto-4-pentenoate hydratase [Ilumatobacter sp.]|uniref:2-keto-4-pentenoate hydratase n=1 Tax=Ilumatobacter sp. TaxID=1967498 RepID=UPI0039188E38
MGSGTVEQAAKRLADADSTRRPCEPVRDLIGTDDIGAAYAVQRINRDAGVAAGRRVSGHKIGLTSLAVQRQLGVDQPDFGVLFADMEVSDGTVLDGSRLMQPRAEAEVALIMGTDLDLDDPTLIDVINATAYALPAIEIVDSRIADWNISLADTVADNASCGLYVVGGRPVPLADVDLRTMSMTMTLDDEVVSEGTGAACLGHPLHAARWLADTLRRLGEPIRAGQVLMTGALGPMVPVSTGQRLFADLGDLGTVSATIGEIPDRD